jgi:hypothetical protein
VRFPWAGGMLAIFTLIATPCVAQTHLRSLEDLRNALAPGDLITVVSEDGQPITGRLIRFGDADLDLRVGSKHPSPEGGLRDVTMPVSAIQSLERRRDPARNGAALGAGVGAGVGGAMFAYAFVVDRNEMDEWTPAYLGATAVFTGMGALIGWAIDATRSKPHIAFEPSSPGKAKVSMQPVYLRRRGIGLAVSF